MIKYVVNTPKGGVGKTTVSTNLALLLADRGYKVWALDLAQGSLMSLMLNDSGLFNADHNIVDTREGDELPTSFPGSSNFDYMVVDTDDYWQYLTDVLREVMRGWRLISPVPPDDQIALDRVPGDLGILATAALTIGSSIPFKVVANRTRSVSDRQLLEDALSTTGIASHLSVHVIPFTPGHPRDFYRDPDFANALDGILAELG